jgi:CRP-like cAMP-binding protein
MWSSVFVMVNIYVISRLIYDRMAVYKDEQERYLSRTFNQFSPGMFRKLMAIGHMNKAYSVTRLSTEGKRLDRLYFVIDGGISIEKEGRQFDYMAGAFIGEVAYLTSMPASATVLIPESTNYVVWHHAALRSLGKKHPDLKARLEAMFNQDMARKVQFS